MELLEGQALNKETNFVNIKQGGFVDTNQPPLVEDSQKSESGIHLNEKILAGSVIGSSDFASAHAQKILRRIGFKGERFVHGAGIRLVCRKFLTPTLSEGSRGSLSF